ncbi:Crp/Fnr family transcriptional regulator [Shinella curvata]|uniref:Crp/Fnr family transcriptional regulator n=1 Tax=Shinella curvata TaxID=1817964 RepID=A0ABT8XCK2_9HYPH|nr:Crp/Fnr family transcriptional regulator [Shinella curvata]MCJ8054448.1 Crp/Fnr family transcriptional regulator [Shinella curvata]MDO6121469.1 Crp/Fnr family transcriptional regulator [Shinella curvata]
MMASGTVGNQQTRWRTPCQQCPLRTLPDFRDFTPKELDFVSHFKSGELSSERGATILVEGMHSAHLFTVLSGWAFRYKLLPDGRRQIMNYVLPGDLIGLQGSLMGEMDHSVEALTPVTLCVFERSKLERLFERHASLAYDLTWIASAEERILDEHLLSIGRRTALERTAYLLSFIHQRAHLAGVNGGRRVIPITQQHVADTLGLSLVHTNKTLRKLADRKLMRWQEKGCEILDADGLQALAGWEGLKRGPRPFI